MAVHKRHFCQISVRKGYRMNYAALALLFSMILSPFCSSLHAARRVSTRELMRLAEGARQKKHIPPSSSTSPKEDLVTHDETPKQVATAVPARDINLPSHPGSKNSRWTTDQQNIWGRIEKQRLIVHSVIQPNPDKVKEPVVESLYVDGLKKLEDVFDENLIGTDPRHVIASLPQLQQLLLHTILHIPSPEHHSYGDNPAVKEAVVELYKELFSQWETLGLDSGAMAPYITHVDAGYAAWTDQPLSSQEEKALSSFQSALAILDTKTDDTIHTPEERTRAAKTLKMSFKTLADTKAFSRSSYARSVAISIPDDFAEKMPEPARENVLDTLNMIEDHLERLMYTQKQQQKIAQLIDGAQADIDGSEPAHREAAKIIAFLARELWQNPEKLYPAENFAKVRVVKDSFFTRANIVMQPCTEAMKRFRQLATSNEEIFSAIKTDDFPIIQVLDLPEAFFARAQQLPSKLRYPFC